MCDQQSLRSACADVQSDRSLFYSLEYSMGVKLLTEQHLELLSLKGVCTGSSESTLVKIPHCLKPHVAAHMCLYPYRSWSMYISYKGSCDVIVYFQESICLSKQVLLECRVMWLGSAVNNSPLHQVAVSSSGSACMVPQLVPCQCTWLPTPPIQQYGHSAGTIRISGLVPRLELEVRVHIQ